MKLKAKTGDLILAGVAVALGIAILILIKVQNLELVKRKMMGPGFFPLVCGIAIIFFGVLLFVEVATQSRKAKTEMSELPGHHRVLSSPEIIRGRRLRGRSILAVKSN